MDHFLYHDVWNDILWRLYVPRLAIRRTLVLIRIIPELTLLDSLQSIARTIATCNMYDYEYALIKGLASAGPGDMNIANLTDMNALAAHQVAIQETLPFHMLDTVLNVQVQGE